ncbi:aa3-type cytochrome c oxidase subunit IV [Paracraurococcus ruber]|uniref:aa3-type cytochrome c oxidase subunit IV n=1 Tax=Paracraurococcus ruber TaxID=77675 RepID=UPI00195FC124|nr:aa3-type cytochrome c oxidase subunit IV [Paracraurococcus ruber]
MAEKESYEFGAVNGQDLLADRQRGWEGFTQFVTYGVVATVVVLLGLLLFVA